MANKTKVKLNAPSAPIDVFKRPFQRFAQFESSGGILLLFCAIVAMIWANSPFSDSYFGLWQTKVGVNFGEWISLEKPLLLWINDALMAIFFFLVGLEIKREILVGELATARKAALPIAAALGGMVAPALLYLTLNFGKEGAKGWGVPMATDIAFALGVLQLLGKRVPLALKVFLTALAIVDDLGAVLVIAIFYTADLAISYLGYGAFVLIAMIVANFMGVRNALVYFLMGGVLWYCMLKSGVHSTLAGVLAAMTIPARARIDGLSFASQLRSLMDIFHRNGQTKDMVLTEDQHAAVESIEHACEAVQTPLQRLEHQLLPWVAFGIMPLFAFANAGLHLGGDLRSEFTSSISLGIILGLFVGKPLGITFFSWLVVRIGWAELPQGVTWRHVMGVASLAGIGFTMALFIAMLAFPTPENLQYAKVGILTASLLSGALGFWLVRSAPYEALLKVEKIK
ncbi:MAG: Na+/H+ antiporter NhaA [Fimbriimonadia bacterium]|nr:Na+/H+ antiporter NhaA [Fimbriimonadia bacterium]